MVDRTCPDGEVRSGLWAGRLAPASGVRSAAGLTIVSVHFSADPAARARHLGVYRDLVAAESPALVLGGDLNENPKGPSITALIPPLRYADPHQGPTSPVDSPRTRLDSFLVGGAVEARPAEVLRGPDVLVGSDHCPVLILVSHRAWS